MSIQAQGERRSFVLHQINDQFRQRWLFECRNSIICGKLRSLDDIKVLRSPYRESLSFQSFSSEYVQVNSELMNFQTVIIQ
jgi:hypothetical protein